MPREIRFGSRHELALERLDEQTALLPHRWIAGDDERGRRHAPGEVRRAAVGQDVAAPDERAGGRIEASQLAERAKGIDAPLVVRRRSPRTVAAAEVRSASRS